MQDYNTIIDTIQMRLNGCTTRSVMDRYKIGSGTLNLIMSRYNAGGIPIEDLRMMAPEEIVDRQLWTLRKYHGKDNRYALHVILAFAPSESKYLDHTKALEIGYYLAQTEFTNCMCYFGVHDHSCYEGTNQLYLHIDMMLVPFDIFNGKSYDCGKPGWIKIIYDVAAYLQKYVPVSEISQPLVFHGQHDQKF